MHLVIPTLFLKFQNNFNITCPWFTENETSMSSYCWPLVLWIMKDTVAIQCDTEILSKKKKKNVGTRQETGLF